MLTTSKHWHVYLLLLLTTLFWSSNVVIGKAVNAMIDPLALSFWRWLIATIVVLPFSYSQLRLDWPVIRQAWSILFVLSFLGVSLFNTILYFSTHSTTATNIALIQTSLPVFVVLLSFLVYRQRTNIAMLLGVVLGIAGATLVIFKGEWHSLQAFEIRTGDVSMLCAVFVYALYSVLLPKAPKIHPNSLLAITIILGSLLLTPFYVFSVNQSALLVHLKDLAWPVLYIAIFPSILAYRFWNQGVSQIGASATGLFICFIPVFTAIIAAIFLHETLYAYHAIGLVMIVTGVFIVHRYGKQLRDTANQ